TPSIGNKSSMEDLMFDLIKASSNRITTMENNVLIIVGNVHNMSTTMQSLVVGVVNFMKASHTSITFEARLREQCNVVILRSGKSLTESNAKEKLEAKKPMNLEEEVE
ncbi:unnamed protein product, partial [Citrullus colocynthis]